MKTFYAVPASSESYDLGEGPVWDTTRQRLLWVDIDAGRVHEGRLVGRGHIHQIATHQFTSTVGAVAPAADGRLLVAEDKTLTVLDTEGRRTAGPRIVAGEECRRLNDGKCDPSGRFLVGTKSLGTHSNGDEYLVQLRCQTAVPIDNDLELSNGLGWSTSGTTLYSIDTLAATIWSRPYDSETGSWGTRTRLFTVTDGYPDGMAVDAEDNLWIAIWGAGEVRCYTTSGEQRATVKVGAPHTSSVAFIGEQLDVLMITTARSELSDEALRDYPDSGRLFLADAGVAGAPVPHWSG